ncbi:MAG TPA: helix-turn-helix transcriptional regulator, partial [Aldersonia sp.]
ALKAAREAKGMSVVDVARVADVAVSALRAWERGDRGPQVDRLAAVAQVLDVPMNTLVDLDPVRCTLVDLRILTGRTQNELARSLGMSTTALGSLERAEVRLTDERAGRLAGQLGVDVDAVRRAYTNAKRRAPGTPA